MSANDIDRIISGLERISLLAQLREKVREAIEATAQECGNCQHWMKSSSCPREHNVNGRNRGPSMSAPACSLFMIEPRCLELQRVRIAEAVAFARQHGLPEPPFK